jgi:hypothetical protein
MEGKTNKSSDMGIVRCDTIDGIFGEKDVNRRAA